MLKVRKANERGGGDHGWLKSQHSFSFSDYYDPRFMGFGPLRVINEDWIAAGKGFGMHPHNDMEIITYVVKGALEHQDSMGNKATILPGEVQKMTAGTGVFHSEFNPRKDLETHLLQIWIMPDKRGLKPSYSQKSFEEQLNKEKLVLVVSPNQEADSIGIAQDAKLYVSRLKKDDMLEHSLSVGRAAWIQVIKGSVSVNDVEITAGDGLAVVDEKTLRFKSLHDAEFMLFDLKS